ncbi:hypothetical protein Tco_1125932 [Tanacetum coccineum]
MASGGSDRNAEDALSKLLQRGTVAKYQNKFEMLRNRVTGISEGLLKVFYISGLKPALKRALLRLNPTTLDQVFSLARVTEARFTNLQLLELLRSTPTTLGEAFSFRALITEARFEDEHNLAVDNTVGDQKDSNVNDKQEVKKVDADIGVDEVSSAIDGVFDIGKSNVESMEVCSKFGKFLENKENIKEVVVGSGEALGVDKDELNRVISVLKDGGGEFDDSLTEINLGLSESFERRKKDVVLCLRQRKAEEEKECWLQQWKTGSFAHKRIWDLGIKIFFRRHLEGKVVSKE